MRITKLAEPVRLRLFHIFNGPSLVRSPRAEALRHLPSPPRGAEQDDYFDSSARAALALSTAGPSVTFWKAAMACGFISLAL